MKCLLILLCLALEAGVQTGSGCTPTSVPALIDGRIFMCIDPQGGWHLRRPRLADLMPIVEPLPPPVSSGLLVMDWRPLDIRANEPIDVPAIQEQRMECVIPNQTVASSFQCELSFGSGCPCGSIQPVKHDTCTDKSRVLLTDESGARHCVKFGGAQ